jgi:hypothetical protein
MPNKAKVRPQIKVLENTTMAVFDNQNTVKIETRISLKFIYSERPLVEAIYTLVRLLKTEN